MCKCVTETTENAIICLVTYSIPIGDDPLCNCHPNTDLPLLLLVRQLACCFLGRIFYIA